MRNAPPPAPADQAGVLHTRACDGDNLFFRHHFYRRDAGATSETYRGECQAEALAVAVRDQFGFPLTGYDRLRQGRVILLDAIWRAELETECAACIGMREVGAARGHHIDAGCGNRRRSPDHRHKGVFDRAVFLVELDRRYLDDAVTRGDGLLKIGPLCFALQLRVGSDVNLATRGPTLDPDDFAPSVGNPDDADMGVVRLGIQLVDEAFSDTRPPLGQLQDPT